MRFRIVQLYNWSNQICIHLKIGFGIYYLSFKSHDVHNTNSKYYYELFRDNVEIT